MSHATVEMQPTDLPSCIAIPLGDVDVATHPFVKLWRVCDAAELLLRFVTALAAAEHGARMPAEVSQAIGARIERPTLGDWLALAKALARTPPPDPVIPELLRTVEDLLAPLIYSPDPDRLSGVGQLRNRLAHGAGLSDEAARALLEVDYVGQLHHAIRQMGWLRDVQLLAQRADGGVVALAGEHPEAVCAAAVPDEARAALTDPAGGVVAVRGHRVLALWPLHAYSRPSVQLDAAWSPHGAAREAPLVYARHERRYLQMTALGSPMPVAELREGAVQRLRSMFRLDEVRSHDDPLVVGFKPEMRSEASRLVGRTSVLATLKALCRVAMAPDSHPAARVLWVSGVAGSGKSAVMAKLSVILEGMRGEGTIAIPWRFSAGDSRCSRVAFLRHAIAQLEAWEQLGVPEVAVTLAPRELEARLDVLLRIATGAGLRSVFVLDGLDEALRIDQEITEVPFRLNRPGVVWVLASRSVPELESAAERGHCTRAFPSSGLPPLDEWEIAEWLKREAPPRDRDDIVREEGPRGQARWIEEVKIRSGGLAVYLALLVDDMQAGVVRANTAIPASLEQYFDSVVARCGADDAGALLPTLLTLVASAAHAPDAASLAELARRAGALEASTRGSHMKTVGEALERARIMLRGVTDGEGRVGWLPYHDELTRHLGSTGSLRDRRAAARGAWIDFCSSPERSAEPATASWGASIAVRQLIHLGMSELAAQLLQRPSYVATLVAIVDGDPAVTRRRLAEDYSSVIRSALARDDGESAAALLEMAATNIPRDTASETEATADQLAAWLAPAFRDRDSLPHPVIKAVARLSSSASLPSRRVAQEIAAAHAAIPVPVLERAMRRATPGEERRMRAALYLAAGNASERFRRMISLTPSLLAIPWRRHTLLASLELAAKTVLNEAPGSRVTTEIIAFWTKLLGHRRLRWLARSRVVSWLVARRVNRALGRAAKRQPDLPRSLKDLFESVDRRADALAALLPCLLGPRPDLLHQYRRACLEWAEDLLGLEQAVLYGVLLVQGVWDFDGTRALLRFIFDAGSPRAKMLVHAILLRIFQQTQGAEQRRRVSEEIFRIADLEAELPHVYGDVGAMLGDRSVYHPFAPAGTACAEAEPGRPLRWFVEYISRARHLAPEERVRRTMRAAKDLLWMGIYYPTETFETLPTLLDLPEDPEAHECLLDTVAQLTAVHGAVAERFVLVHLAGRATLHELRERVDHAWLDRYVNERGAGQASGALLLRHEPLRRRLVELITDALTNRQSPSAHISRFASGLVGLLPGVSRTTA